MFPSRIQSPQVSPPPIPPPTSNLPPHSYGQALRGGVLGLRPPQIYSLPLPTKGLAGQSLARPWALPSCPGEAQSARPVICPGPGLRGGGVERQRNHHQPVRGGAGPPGSRALPERCPPAVWAGRGPRGWGRNGSGHSPGPSGVRRGTVPCGDWELRVLIPEVGEPGGEEG